MRIGKYEWIERNIIKDVVEMRRNVCMEAYENNGYYMVDAV